MIEYTTRYDVKKTMYEKFADSAAQHTNEPCFYGNMETLAAILRLQGFEAVLSWIGELIFYPMLLGYFLLLTCAIFESCRFAHLICRSALPLYMR